MDFSSKNEKEIKRTLERINSLESIIGSPMYKINEPEVSTVEIKVDNKIEHGKFLPSKVQDGLWYASEQTYRAMKKDIFATGDTIDELVSAYTCHSCKTDLDKQFWHFCPYCGERFLE